MFSEYYQSELTYLREMGREFAAAHPAMAGLLGERSGDPDVERLLEGFAFLSAKIYERIDNSVPELVHRMCELLLPQYLRPVPAATIVEFKPDIQGIRGIRSIARNTNIAATPVNGTSCTFRTSYDVDLLPIDIVDAKVDTRAENHPRLTINFRTTDNGAPLLARKEGIRLFLHGDASIASNLRVWMLECLTKIEFRAPGRGTILTKGPECISQVGFENDQAVLPWPDTVSAGYRFVQEWLTIPEKFRFIDITGLEGLVLEGEEFEAVFEFRRPPPITATISADQFRLHCSPAINVFEVSADPILVDALTPRKLVRASGIRPEHMEVYDVTSVVGIREGRRTRRTYQPFFGYRHVEWDPATGLSSSRPFYALDRTPSPVDNGTDTYMVLVNPEQPLENVDARETLSIELTCTNRYLPNELKIGDVCKPARGTPMATEFKNITPVVEPARAPLGSELHWRVVSHLALNREGLSSARSLKNLLHLYNFQLQLGNPQGKSNERYIDGIRSVACQPTTRMLRGAPVRGSLSQIEFDETVYGGIGDVHLFATVLDQLFASHVGLNSFNQMQAVLHPSRSDYSWMARTGQRKIL